MKKIMYSMLAFMMAAFTFTSCEDVPAPYGLPTGGTEGGGTILPEGTFLDADFTSSLGKFKSMSAEGDGSIQWKINYSSACITGYDKWDGADTKSNKAGVTYLVSPEVDLTKATEAHVELNQALKYERADINTNNSLLITDNFTGDVKTTTWKQLPYNTDGLNDASTKEFVFVTNAANIPAEFMGKKVVIALRHTCSDSQSSTWEVKTLKVLAGKANVTVPDTPVTPDTPSANPQGKGTADDPFNVDAALKYITDGGNADTEVYIKGKISKLVRYNEKYNNINYNIVDEKSGQELQVYAGLGLDGAKFQALTDLKVGQVVVICGKLTTYMGTKQVDKNSKIISITGEGEAPAPDESGSLKGDLVYVAANCGLENQTALTTLKLSDDLTLTFDGGGNNNAPKYYSAGMSFRMYPKNSVKFTSTKKIASVTIKCDIYNGTIYNASGNMTASVGKFSVVGETDNVTITDINSTEFTLTDSSTTTGAPSQFRIKEIAVTYAK